MRFVLRAAGIGAALAFGACSPAEKKPAESAAAAPAEEPAAAEPAGPTEPATETEAPQAAGADASQTATTVTLAATDASGAPLVGDLTRGKKIFGQCMTCHTLDAGVNRVGPSLHGVIGRPAGSVPGFKYSRANAESHITWTEQELFAYLENPRARVPGTIMAFIGLKDAQQRADVIAYIKANGGGAD